MLGPDIVVEQAIRFFGRKLQHPFRFSAERNLHRRGHLLAEHRTAFDVLPNPFEGQVRTGEDTTGQAFALPDQTEQQVLCFDRDTPQLARLVAGKEQHAAGTLCITLEHSGDPATCNAVLAVRPGSAGDAPSAAQAGGQGRRPVDTL